MIRPSEDRVRCPGCERYFNADDAEWDSNAGAPGTDGLCVECAARGEAPRCAIAGCGEPVPYIGDGKHCFVHQQRRPLFSGLDTRSAQ